MTYITEESVLFSRVPRRRRRLAILGLPLILAMTAAGCGNNSLSGESSASGDAVKVGLVIPQSGVYEPLGIDMQNGFQLYLDEHNSQLGGKTVTVTTADEGEGPDVGVPAINKLITQDQVNVAVGVVNSATALGAKDAFSTAKVPLIVANAGADELADGSEYLWRTSFTNGAVGESLGAEVAKEVGAGSVYLMAADYAAGQETLAGFKKSFEAAGGKVAGESMTPFGTTNDWQPYLSQAQKSGAKAVFVFYAGAEAVKFVQQYKQFGLGAKVPLYGAGFLTEGGVLTAQGADAVGVKTTLHYSNMIDTPENKAFVEAYTAKYNSAPTVYSVQAYDAAKVLDLALTSADGTSGEAIATALGTLSDIESPRGTWRFDEQHNPDQPYFLREVEAVDGGFGNTVVATLTE